MFQTIPFAAQYKKKRVKKDKKYVNCLPFCNWYKYLWDKHSSVWLTIPGNVYCIAKCTKTGTRNEDTRIG